MTIKIRRGTEKDVDWLIGQLRDFDKFAGFKHSLLGDETYARAALKEMVAKHICFIAEKAHCAKSCPTQTPVGFIAGYKMGHPFNPKLRVLTETFWWVSPEHRSGRAALLLLNTFEAHGRATCDWITMSLQNHSPVRTNTLTKRGFAVREQSFLLEV